MSAFTDEMSAARGVLRKAALNETGEWIAGLASWNWFWTLTHDAVRLDGADSSRPHALVGQQRHRSLVRRWVFGTVRVLDPSAQWWSETERHQTGQCHEHGLMAASDTAPWLKMRQAWYELAGYAVVRPIERLHETDGKVLVARYVAKYSEKAAAGTPLIAGFGLLPSPSHSLVLR